jgi:hypothetical protein
MMLAGGIEPERDSVVACLEIEGRWRANLGVVGDLCGGGAGGTTALSAASSGVASTLNSADILLLLVV